jgi:hypothetical protein
MIEFTIRSFGANLLASDIKLEIGGNLLLKSRQNLSESDSYNIGMSLGISGNSSGVNGGSEGSQELIDGGNLTINTRSLKSWLNDCNQNCLRSKLHYKTQLNLRYNLSGILPKILFRFLLKMGALPVIKLDDERPARILSYEKTKDALAQNLAKKAMEDFASQSFEKAKINFWLSILTRNDFGQVL